MLTLLVVLALLVSSLERFETAGNVDLGLSDSQRKERAQFYYQRGMDHIISGNAENGLAHLRTACRLDNQSSLFWNDLGVTEMRAGQLKRARKRFLRALQLDPLFSPARNNLQDLTEYLEQVEPNLSEPEVRTFAEHEGNTPLVLSKKDFLAYSDEQVASLMKQPFIVQKFVSKYKMKSLFSLANLQQRYGEATVDYYPHNMQEEQVHPFLISLQRAIAQLTAPDQAFLHVDASEPGTYIQWNLDAAYFDDLQSWANLTLPGSLSDSSDMSCMRSSQELSEFYLKTHWKMLLIGEAMAGMFLHQDILLTGAYQLQLVGRKRWFLCASNQSAHLYQAGAVDFFSPNYDLYPLARQAVCSKLTLQPGDLLYYPDSYWHQTRNLDTPTIALSSSVITRESVMLLVEELDKECQGARRIFAPTQEVCESIRRCGTHWLGRHQSSLMMGGESLPTEPTKDL